MHLPDGFLSTEVWPPLAVTAAGSVAFLDRARPDLLSPEARP